MEGVDRLRSFAGAACRHPWARFDFLQLSSGLSEFKARQARTNALEAGYVETVRIAGEGQPRPPRRYGLTPKGAYEACLPLPRVDRRAQLLLAAPHLEVVRQRILSEPVIRERLVWSISPWRAAPGITLDALACLRGRASKEVLVAFAAPPPGAAEAWWYVELASQWFRFRRTAKGIEVGLAVLGTPFAPKRYLILASSRRGRRRRGPEATGPVHFLVDSKERADPAEAKNWIRVPALPSGPLCPWDDPELMPSEVTDDTFLDGKIPRAVRQQHLTEWSEDSVHSVASALRPALEMTHGQMTLLQGLLRYPAFAAGELSPLIGLRRRTVLDGLQQLEELGLAEILPLFAHERRFVLTERGLNLSAYRSMQTPARFRARRSWPTAHEPLTTFPDHMDFILSFMFALQRQSCLLHWDLVHARYGYSIVEPPGSLARTWFVDVVPDSSGVMAVNGREHPFWLEIDRGTRTGKKLTRQLEKYILVRFSDAASAPIPVLLYVVAEGGENRARLVARKLVKLAGSYSLQRTPAILITTWELLTDGDRASEPDPLRPVWRLPFNWSEFLSPVPPVEVRRQGSNGG